MGPKEPTSRRDPQRIRGLLRSGRRSGARAANRAGFTLIEIMIVASVVLIGLLAMSKSLGTSIRLTGTNRETALATDALREQIELLAGAPDFDQVFATYVGTGFDVPGLDPVLGDPDGMVGEILFPSVVGAGGPELREHVVLPDFPIERDLDLDGTINQVASPGPYVLLPVLVRLTWRGTNGDRTMELRTLLADR